MWSRAVCNIFCTSSKLRTRLPLRIEVFCLSFREFSSAMEDKVDRIKGWAEQWDKNNIGWHSPNVHKQLQKHSSLLWKEGETKKFFVPPCGKIVDMKWLSDKGHTVVGLDGVKKSLEDFCSENGLERTEEDAVSMGPGCQVLKVKERELKLYNGDIFLFNKSLEGQFDCIWDRGSIVALDRKDIKAYVALIKDLLKPGGKIFVEVFEYDDAFFAGHPRHPPPFAVFEAEMRSLFEPDCSVEQVERDQRTMGAADDKITDLVYYLIVKK